MPYDLVMLGLNVKMMVSSTDSGVNWAKYRAAPSEWMLQPKVGKRPEVQASAC